MPRASFCEHAPAMGMGAMESGDFGLPIRPLIHVRRISINFEQHHDMAFGTSH